MIKQAKWGRMVGLTLVELLVSIALSILLMTGAISIFIASKESFNVGEDLSRVQENIRFITSRIFKDVTLAGYVGCAPFPEGELLADISTVPGFMNAAAEGQLGDFSKAIIGSESDGPNSSDSLTIHFALVSSAMRVDPKSYFGGGRDEDDEKPNNFYDNEGEDPYEGDEIIVISDCKAAIFAKLNQAPSKDDPLDFTGIAAESYSVRLGISSPLYYYKMDGVTYQLATVGPDSDGKYVSQLMATRLSAPNNPQPLLDGVEDFQIEYGIDLNKDLSAERYLNWNQIVGGNHQTRIVSVRISLVMNAGEPQTDALGQVTDVEKNMVKNSVFTVALRNRGNF